MLVPYTRTIFKLFPVTLRISRSPSSVNFSQYTSSRFFSIGRDFTPSLNPTPVILVQDTFRHLSLLLDILSIFTSPASSNSSQLSRFRVSRLERDFTSSSNPITVILVLTTFRYLSLLLDIISISASPSSTNSSQHDKFRVSRFGRRPSLTPIPEFLVHNTSRYLS